MLLGPAIEREIDVCMDRGHGKAEGAGILIVIVIIDAFKF